MENFKFGHSHLTRNEIIQLLLRVSIASVVTFYSVKWMMNQLDPTTKNKKKAKLRAEEQLRKLRAFNDFNANTENFNDYELMIASHLVVPSDIAIGWSDIAGLDSVIQELRESVVLPILHKHLIHKSKLWQAPKGVLLHGPPGCGKTLIAKATAKEAGMRFINLDVAILTDKWYGESQKLASAVFSLALKIQPCIIFIDEIDSFLRSRNSNDHEATAMMKTQFMMLWDGLVTTTSATVIVMGATNRPQDLDKAIMRRMPAQFHIALPSEMQRVQILKLMLDSEEIEGSVDYNKLASLTNGYSGSDLREMCRNASVFRMRQLMLSNAINFDYTLSSDNSAVTAIPQHQNSFTLKISMEDLLHSFNKLQESKAHAGVFFLNNRIELD